MNYNFLKEKKYIYYFIVFDMIIFWLLFYYSYFNNTYSDIIYNNEITNDNKNLYIENINIVSYSWIYQEKEDIQTKNLEEETVFEKEVNLTENIDNKKLSNSKEFIKKETLKIEDEKPKQENIFDFLSDNSIHKFVSNKVSFNKLSYVPDDLIFLKWDYLTDTKWNSKIREIMNNDLQKLSKDFYNTFWVKLKIVSAYRSYSYQKWIKDRWCSDLFCAKAWFSEHQTWLAIDIFETTTQEEFLSKNNYKKYFEWMTKNAYKYGFHNTYRRWREVDWYAIEPWHWRYLWYDLSKILYEKDMTFAEYIKNWN